MYYKCQCKECSMLFKAENKPAIPLCDACADADCDMNGKSPCNVRLGSARQTVTISAADEREALGYAAKVCENTMETSAKEDPRGCQVLPNGDKVWVDELAGEVKTPSPKLTLRQRWERFKSWRPWKGPTIIIVALLGLVGCDATPLEAPQDEPTAAITCPEGQAPAPAWGGTCQAVSPAWWPLIGPMRTDCPFGWGPMPVIEDPARPFWTCQCEQGCGPCPDGWHKAGEWGATCERDGEP